ncbi:MAG: L,D-transpeptidase family protein [Proteobacteria bacterium]|nr:L,D-transpeptidase family protein [Pseudomonadota bacterium]
MTNRVNRQIRILASFSVMLGCGSTFADTSIALDAVGRMPAYFLEIPESVTDILIAETGAATMYRFVHDDNGIVEKDRRYMSIGQAGAGKEKAWDRKTPLGIYFITESLDTSKLGDKYGVAAFPLDYPNAWDRFNKRTGYGIWLHGVDRNKPERPALDTDGCLALPNEELLRLVDRLEPLVTPVIVARQLDWALPADLDALRLEFHLALDMWRESQQRGDLAAYLSLYADDFEYREMDRDSWSSYRLQVFDARELKEVSLEDIMLVADPEVPDLYLSRFTQILTTANGPVTTTKRLYWRRSDGNTWKIVSEDSG